MWTTVNVLVSLLNVVQMRYILTVVPSDVLGRVQGFAGFASYGGMPLGLVATGLALDGLGGRGTVLVFSAVLVALALYASFSRDMRTEDTASGASTDATPDDVPA
ncbi:MAG: hypothetical protein FWJ87_09420 [Micromonosporaceae bacterium]